MGENTDLYRKGVGKNQYQIWLDMVSLAYDPGTGKLRQEDCRDFSGSQGYVVRAYLK